MPPQLPTRQLGKDGPHVTALGFGAMGLSAFYGKTGSDDERLKFLDHVYELGETNWDSADMYADNEDLIGKWFKRTGKRNDIFLATKFGIVTNPDGTRGMRSDPEHVKEACEKSLKRLGIECIDLYYCHRVDGKTPVEKTVEAMAELKKYVPKLPHLNETGEHSNNTINRAGKIKYLGFSEVSASTLRRACRVHHISAVQIEYSPFTIDIENPQIALLKTCRELGVATVAYSPLGRGFITGQIRSPDDFEADDFRRMAPRFQGENFNKNLKLVDRLGEIAKKKGCTPGQLTLAWLMRQGEDIVPIPGTKKTKYLEENLGALKVKLTDEEDKEIRDVVEAAEVHGGRYPDEMMKTLFADTPEL